VSVAIVEVFPLFHAVSILPAPRICVTRLAVSFVLFVQKFTATMKARVAEQAERYEDMVTYVNQVMFSSIFVVVLATR